MKTYNHDAFDIFKPIGFPDTHRKIQGVYGIATVYVGASVHIRRRLTSHYTQCMRGHHSNSKLQAYFDEMLNKDLPILVWYLNKDPRSEKYFSQKIIGERNGSEKYYHEIQDYKN